jgi:hypothetical protein
MAHWNTGTHVRLHLDTYFVLCAHQVLCLVYFTCAAPVPHSCSTCASLMQHLCLAYAAPVPRSCSTCASLMQHLCSRKSKGFQSWSLEYGSGGFCPMRLGGNSVMYERTQPIMGVPGSTSCTMKMKGALLRLTHKTRATHSGPGYFRISTQGQ